MDEPSPMIPVRAERRPPGLVVAVWVIAAACAAVFVRLLYLDNDQAVAIIEMLAVVPARLTDTPYDPAELFTLLSSAFLHAGWIHLGGNLLYLSVFGPTVEARMGWWRFTSLYVISGMAGAIAQVAWDPASTVPMVGASGAIAGVLGAHLVLEPRSRITTVIPVIIFIEIASLPAAFVIALWFLLQVASALAPVSTAGLMQVAWFAHLGGFVAGALLASIAASRSRSKRQQPSSSPAV
jgi:membrane associated rhomboid family serine protease